MEKLANGKVFPIRSLKAKFHQLQVASACYIEWKYINQRSDHVLSISIHLQVASHDVANFPLANIQWVLTSIASRLKTLTLKSSKKKESNPIISVSTTGCYAMPFRSRQRELNSSAKQQENNKITRFCVRDEISRWKVFCCFSVFLAIFSCERKNIFLMLRWKKKKNKKIRWEWFTASVLEVILMLARIRNVSLTLFSEAFVIIKTWRDPSTCFIVFRVASAHARDTNIIVARADVIALWRLRKGVPCERQFTKDYLSSPKSSIAVKLVVNFSSMRQEKKN